VRGKLHTLMTERAAREQRRRDGLARFSRGEALALILFALIQTTVAVGTFLVVIQHG
jgi:hypothetical protein